MPVMSNAYSRPRPSRLNDSDKPSEGAQGSSISGLAAAGIARSSLARTAATKAGHTASIPARRGKRVTNHAAAGANTNGERMKKAITALQQAVSVNS